MLICLALSGKLAGKWAPALQVSETKVHNGDTSTKTSKQTQIKKVGDDSSNQKEEQDSKGGPELAEALEVLNYICNTCCPFVRYHANCFIHCFVTTCGI